MTIKCEELYKVFKEQNLDYFTGVPDSTFKDWMKFLADNHENGLTNRIAVNECEAVSLAAGYHLATGNIGVIYMQNSGLGKTVNPLTSLTAKEVYSIPTVLMIGWRGNPKNEKKDEPQHKMMGKIMLPLLDVLEIPYKVLEEKDDINIVREKIFWAKQTAKQTNYATAIIMTNGLFEEYDALKKIKTNYEMFREDAIKFIINNLGGDEIIISTTGKTSRELFEYRESLKQGHEKDFLTVGSMGCSSSIALEIALQKPNKKVFIFDGDGATLMQLGALATVGHNNPKNLTHIIFDNNAYDSTGGQPTSSDSVDFKKIASACGYMNAKQIESKKDLVDFFKEIKNLKQEGPKILVIKVNKGARKDLGRPTITPIENKQALMDFLGK